MPPSQTGFEREATNEHYEAATLLYRLGRLEEAQIQIEYVIHNLDRSLGPENSSTLHARKWYGKVLFEQSKYAEAEPCLRQVVQGYSKKLGVDHADTFDSKLLLACVLEEQRKYAEAEPMFREVLRWREQTVGANNEATLRARCWLACALNEQNKYAEAELHFRQVVHARVDLLGAKHKDTIHSRSLLSRVLYDQQKMIEAVKQMRQVVLAYGEILGADDKDTIYSMYWLGRILIGLGRYGPAEETLRKAVLLYERTRGPDHEKTTWSKRALREQAFQVSLADTKRFREQRTEYLALGDFFMDGQDQYAESDVVQISVLLSSLDPAWGKIPRTYIVLRELDLIKFLERFIALGFSDDRFPVTERSLSSFLDPPQRKNFVAAQKLVMTSFMDLEKGEQGQHAYFHLHASVPFESLKDLGSGGYGSVDKVRCLTNSKEYARKSVSRSSDFGSRQAAHVKHLVTEIKILKRLHHQHVVQFVGSYNEPKCIGLIMSPVAEMDFCKYLESANRTLFSELRTFFGCLARGLDFLHKSNVRHKDIKPSNILVNKGNVLYTDFGLSLDSTDADGSTTYGPLNGLTRRYCAPEVAREESRNTASDIWSLGVVFLEMIVVLKAKSVDWIEKFFKTHGNHNKFVHLNPGALVELITKLKGTEDKVDDCVFWWIKSMLTENLEKRPKAAALVKSVVKTGRSTEGSNRYCGTCCVGTDADLDDVVDDEVVDEFADEFQDYVHV